MSSQKVVYIGNTKEVPVGESKKFHYPTGDPKGTARPALLIHLEDGFVAYDGLCTHMQAEVEWNKYTEKIELKIEANGDIYAIV